MVVRGLPSRLGDEAAPVGNHGISGDEAADSSLVIETDMAGFDQMLPQACTCTLEARFGAGQRDPESVCEPLPRLALDVAEGQCDSVGFG